MFELQSSSKRTIIDEEVKWDKGKILVSKTDTFGTISYVNDVFSDVSEYSKLELIGEPHSIVRHPDMPKVIFKLLWDSLKKDKNIHVIVKNRAKSGRYYWVITDYTVDKDETGKTTGYTARIKVAPERVVKKIKPIYKTLLDLEKLKGPEASELYFEAFLTDELEKTYSEFIIDLFEEEKTKEQKENRRINLKKTLNWFFITDYEE